MGFLDKRAQAGMWATLITIALVMVVFGMSLTIGADIQQDITDDQTAGSTAEAIGNATLNAQLELAQKQSSIVSAGVGIFILGLLIGGFALFRMF